MQPKMEQPQFQKFEDLPEDKKSKFKPTPGGFVKKGAIEDIEKAEHMAYTENTIIDEKMGNAVKMAKERVMEESATAGEKSGKDYDKAREWQRLEGLGKGEEVSSAAERIMTMIKENNIERGDRVEVCLKDSSKFEGWQADECLGEGHSLVSAINWSEDKKKATYALGTAINQGQISFGIRWYREFPVQAIESISVTKKRDSSRFAA